MTANTPGPKELAHQMGLTVDELAQRFVIRGKPVSRRTLYKWQTRFAPFDSEPALRQWLANQGAHLATVAPTLDQQMAAIAAPNNPAARETPLAPPAITNPDGSTYSPAQMASLAQRDMRLLQTEKLELELATLKKELIPRTVVIEIVTALAHEVLSGLTDLIPATLRNATGHLPAEYLPVARAALTTATVALREQLTAKAPALVNAAIGKQGDAQ